MTQKPLLLIDGSSYLFRAFHALPPLTNSKGQPTGAIYGVLNMLRKLLNDYQPARIGVIFDSKSKNFRHQLYPAYKANRLMMPHELQSQIPWLFKAIEALGLPLIMEEGVEADDIIGTLTKKAQQLGWPVIISTGDKDMAQLVNEKVTLINTMSNTVLDIKGVQEKFNVSPKQMVDFLALMGDSVDNIPGVPKVGPKTAALWLEKYQTLENLIQHADEIPGKIGQNLRESISQVLLGRELVTILRDIPLTHTLQQLVPETPDQPALRELFTELEFKNWLAELSSTTSAIAPKKKEFITILDLPTWEKWHNIFENASTLSMEIFTDHFDAITAKMIGVALAVPNEPAVYIPLQHDYLGAPTQLDAQMILVAIKKIVADPNKLVVGHHLKFSLKVLLQQGAQIQAKLWDNLLAAYVLDSNAARRDLSALSLKYLSCPAQDIEELAGKGAKQLAFNQIPIEKAVFYAAERVDLALQLQTILQKKLEENTSLLFVFEKIEIALLPILAKMENAGVLVDVEKLKTHSATLSQQISALEQDVYALAGQEFNLSSPKQLQEILYTQLKLPILKKTPTGQPSTAEDILQELALDYPIPKLVLVHRSLSKLKSTYADALPEQVNSQSGRVHTSYQQAVTSTGRLSSTDPNLQNIPIRSEEGRKIRQAFIAPPGFKILSADYSQVELRIMAHLSNDPGLRRAFAENIDVHRATAAEVFGLPVDQVTSEQRRRAKAINFGLIYGMSAYGLARQLGIAREEAERYIQIYFSRYPKVQEYMESTRRLALKQGFVETLFGRRVGVADIRAAQQQRRLAAERQAINAPLQGTAADMIKLAMIAINHCIIEKNLPLKMIMQVHDELVFEADAQSIDLLTTEIRHCMEGVAQLSVPLLVDIGAGPDWDEAH